MRTVHWLCTGIFLLMAPLAASWAVPITYAGIGAPEQAYFVGDPLVSARMRVLGYSGLLDLERGVPRNVWLFELESFTGNADPAGTHFDMKTFSIGVNVAGRVQTFSLDLAMREIANDQYQVDAFFMPTLEFDLGPQGRVTVTPDPRSMQAGQKLANTDGGGQIVQASFLLDDPVQVPEPGSLPLVLIAAVPAVIGSFRKSQILP